MRQMQDLRFFDEIGKIKGAAVKMNQSLISVGCFQKDTKQQAFIFRFFCQKLRQFPAVIFLIQHSDQK